MSDDLYSNLLRATDNTSDITTEKQGTITKIQDKLCNVKEEATGLEHTNVPVINEVQVKEGDTVLLGFLDNNIYNPVVYGVIGREVKAIIDIDSELSSTSENPVQNKTITSALNGKANNNHSHTSVEVVEGTALTHIGTGAEASQQEVNIAVDSKVDDLNRNVNSLQSEVGSLSDSITDLEADTGWQTLTITNNKFAHYDNGSQSLQIRKVGRIVELTGSLKNTASITLNATEVGVATIPTEYRPIKHIFGLMQGSQTSVFLVTVNKSGALNVSRYRNSTTYSSVASGSWFPIHLTWIV